MLKVTIKVWATQIRVKEIAWEIKKKITTVKINLNNIHDSKTNRLTAWSNNNSKKERPQKYTILSVFHICEIGKRKSQRHCGLGGLLQSEKNVKKAHYVCFDVKTNTAFVSVCARTAGRPAAKLNLKHFKSLPLPVQIKFRANFTPRGRFHK